MTTQGVALTTPTSRIQVVDERRESRSLRDYEREQRIRERAHRLWD